MVSYVKVWTMGGLFPLVSSLVIFHVCSIPLVINLRCDSYIFLNSSVSICQTIINHQLLRRSKVFSIIPRADLRGPSWTLWRVRRRLRWRFRVSCCVILTHVGPEEQRTEFLPCLFIHPDLHETFFFPSSIDQIHQIAVWVTSSAISRVGLPMRMTLCPVVQELPRTMLTTVLTRSDWRSLANISILFCREILSQVVSVGAKVSPFRQHLLL